MVRNPLTTRGALAPVKVRYFSNGLCAKETAAYQLCLGIHDVGTMPGIVLGQLGHARCLLASESCRFAHNGIARWRSLFFSHCTRPQAANSADSTLIYCACQSPASVMLHFSNDSVTKIAAAYTTHKAQELRFGMLGWQQPVVIGSRISAHSPSWSFVFMMRRRYGIGKFYAKLP